MKSTKEILFKESQNKDGDYYLSTYSHLDHTSREGMLQAKDSIF